METKKSPSQYFNCLSERFYSNYPLRRRHQLQPPAHRHQPLQCDDPGQWQTGYWLDIRRVSAKRIQGGGGGAAI